MTARDAFWAAKIMMRLTPDQLAAIVATGEYSRPEDSAYFLETLIERQRMAGRFGINVINPLDEFRLEEGALYFTNLSERYQFVTSETRYRCRWFEYDNDRDQRRRLGDEFVTRSTRLPLPQEHGDARFLLAEIRSLNAEHSQWAEPVSVYSRRSQTSDEIVDIERKRPPVNTFPME